MNCQGPHCVQNYRVIIAVMLLIFLSYIMYVEYIKLQRRDLYNNNVNEPLK
jgi:hypothetical protein